MAKKEKKNTFIYLLSKTWRYSEGNRKNVVLYWCLFIVANANTLIIYPLVMAKVMNVIQQQGITEENIKFIVGLMLLTLLLEFVFWGLHGPARLLECANAFKARTNYRRHLLKGTMTLPMDWHTDHHSGNTIDKIEKGTKALYEFSCGSFEIIYALVQLIVSYAMLVYFSPSAAYIVFAMILISALITINFDRVLITYYQKLNHSENQISESVFDAISNISTVIILRVERLVFGAIMSKVEKPFELFKRKNMLNEIKWFLTNICCNIMTILVLSIYFWQNIGSKDGVLIGSVFLLMKYLDKISELFFNFTRIYGDTVQNKTKVFNSEELSRDFRSENFTNHVLPKDWQHLDIKDLNFSYHENGNGNLNLEDVSMSIAKGERIALVGESGGGKTTFLKIVRDLYHPQNLTLSVDGQHIPQGFEGISRAIALIPQDPEIFATTILENITLGAEYDLDFVRRFTDMACFTDVAENLPNKFDSSIKEKGVNLSGGQQQRLALSRGLLACHDKDIVLLDEPTSSVDLANELSIYQNIFNEFSEKTIISSIHRLHLLPMFDRVCMFKNGKIIGSGTLNELLTSCPQFKELWQKYSECQQNIVE